MAPRTRIRGNQEQDIDFLSESELNDFFGKVVITGTLVQDHENEIEFQDTQVLETFDSFFPGRGLVIGQDGTTVVTGTNFVQVSGTQLGVDTINTVSGSVTINSGTHTTVDTNAVTNTITIDSFDDPDIDSVTTSGVTMTGSLNVDSIGGLSIIPDNTDTDSPTLTISGGREIGQLIGNFFQIEFTNGGSTANTWLAVSDSNLTGHRTPWVVAYQCRLAGIAFSNRNNDVDQDVEIYVAREGDGNVNTLEFTWELRGVRTAAKTDIDTSELQLFQGDKVAVFLRDQGGNARDVFCGIYVEITARTDSEVFENWSGNFA